MGSPLALAPRPLSRAERGALLLRIDQEGHQTVASGSGIGLEALARAVSGMPVRHATAVLLRLYLADHPSSLAAPKATAADSVSERDSRPDPNSSTADRSASGVTGSALAPQGERPRPQPLGARR